MRMNFLVVFQLQELSSVARSPQQLRQDLEKAFSLIRGKHKLNLHAIYLDTEERVDLNELEPKHFEPWVTWAKENGLGLTLIQPFSRIQCTAMALL